MKGSDDIIPKLVSRLANAEDDLSKAIGSGTDAVIDDQGRGHVLLQAQTALLASETRFRTMLNGLEAGVVVHGPDLNITAFNDKATELLGLTASQLTGRSASGPEWSVVGADGAPMRGPELPVSRAQAGRKSVRDVVIGVDRPARQDRIWLLANANPVLTSQGEVAEVIVTFMDVTARIEAERKLSENAKFTEDVLNSLSTQVAVLDENGRIVAVNEPWRRFARENGAGDADFVGSNYFSASDQFGMHAEAGADDEAGVGIRAVLEGREALFVLDYPCHSPGRHRWFRMRVTRLTGGRRGVVVSHVDITESKMAEGALRASESRFKSLFEQVAVGVAQAEANTGRYTQVNQRYCDITGRSRDELLELTAADITHPQYIERDMALRDEIKRGKIREFSVDKRYVRKDGSEVWVNVTVSAMWEPGDTPNYYLAVAQDITERKRLEQKIQQAQKMDAIGTLAGGIAHDFNNILMAIKGYAELAKIAAGDNSEVSENLGDVLRSTNRAADLVQRILAFGRQDTPRRKPVNLYPIAVESLKLLRAIVPSTVQFDTEFDEETPSVLADATQIQQVLMNLGTNAWHAMKGRPGTIHFSLERWSIDEAQAAHAHLKPGVYARVSVSDHGCGMDEATQRRIFEPFFTTKAPGEGTGLGLAVVHGIMETHDGAITVYSQPGEGTVFHLYFPALSGESTSEPIANEPVALGNGERVLYVDDEEVLARLCQKMLLNLGYEADVTTLAATAVAMVQANPDSYSVVITDQTMPGMTGLSLAAKIHEIRPGLPVILMTGYGRLLTPDRLQAAGIYRVLAKPASAQMLGAAVHEALSSQA